MSIINIALLAVGSLFSVLFCFSLLAGQKYDNLLIPLESSDYPLKTIYSAGLYLQDTKLFRLRGTLGDKLRENTIQFYGYKYGEYYARIIWAQALSFVLLSLSVMFLLAGCAKGVSAVFFAVLGLIIAAIFGYYFIHHASGLVTTRTNACEEEFPNAISKIALLVNSGVIIRTAWDMVANSSEGTFYDLMKDSVNEMENGKTPIDAIYTFGVSSGSDNIKKFTTALIQSIERGGGELPTFLANQSSEIWAQHRQYLLQKGEKAASALLAPIALMFMGVMLIVLSAAMSGLSL